MNDTNVRIIQYIGNDEIYQATS